VKQQMDFWIVTKPKRAEPEVWERVTPEERTMVIAVLARLISKAALQENVTTIQGRNCHES
jgi:hypothetical protein